MRFSANLGFLWADRPLPAAIHAAAEAGFDAVECHWPYNTPPESVRAALESTGLPMLGLNTIRGAAGENGLAALPGRESAARAAIDEAIAYADAVDARAIHVMAGFADGAEAHRVFLENLGYACGATPRTILIEPLNRHDAPGYFLQTTDQAMRVIHAVGAANLKLMFDCYHVGRTEGDVLTRLETLLPSIGHIQFASVPDRGPPTESELNYDAIFRRIEELGWPHPLGAEYRVIGATDESTEWLSRWQDA
ncbi:MAG: TIM barrel protein [Pseudomonadota bacterium]